LFNIKKAEITDDERQGEMIDGYQRETNGGHWRCGVHWFVHDESRPLLFAFAALHSRGGMSKFKSWPQFPNHVKLIETKLTGEEV